VPFLFFITLYFKYAIIKGDGHLRKSSFAKMAQQRNEQESVVSDIPLNGFVAALHLVYNERTKEQFVLGGADDGSVAFWELE
jgi:WD repeat-containing protein 7